MNIISLIGNLTSDPEIKETKNNKVYTTFTLAVRRKYSKDETDFINCLAWEKTAELIAMYVGKGDKLAVNGRLQIDKAEDNAGITKYFTKVVVEEITFVTPTEKKEFSFDVEE